MKRLILMAALAVLILPPPAVGGRPSPVEKGFQEGITTGPSKSSGKRRHPIGGPLYDQGKEINGHLEAQQQLQESIKKQSSEGYEDRMKQKRREKAKRLRGGTSPKSRFIEPATQ